MVVVVMDDDEVVVDKGGAYMAWRLYSVSFICSAVLAWIDDEALH